ncbi:hypothetical protein ABB37_00936 [Leptomonas pyrrhocoris]|uniref:Integral membrane bound transporter domain-containing protein n=1 Tax=Leptomonas pyrrhocoris TaxID=157538 RepID=A0A0M9GBE5_LEPPY|nr:hypothetical protein ABB37_00936 [Leptomonas pyrrhocoris]KPA86897.1 hypothetical protein ABB37_00936 [Leptomonas pyrrhocoris]|eukprot:XP_015665336.1 hypothetical protein ABB37_00936 [Leptomonas pyrrhocoris]
MTFSPLHLQQQTAPVDSGILDDEGALFPPLEGRHVRISARDRDETNGRLPVSTAPRKGSRHTGGGDTAHRSHRRRHCGHPGSDSEGRNASRSTSSEEEGEAEDYTTNSAGSAATRATRDSFGYPIYHPIFHHGTLGGDDDFDRGRAGEAARAPAIAGGGGGGAPPPGPTLEVPTTTDVPWDLRNVAEREINKTFAFLSTRYFWFLIEYALRVTCIAMLIPAIIINLNLKHTPFESTTFALTSVVIAVGTNFGQSCVFFVQYIKGGCIWLPLATICSALKLNRYLGAWFVVYLVLLFLMAMFTEKTTRRMCLLLYNISMVSLLSGDESLLFPTRVLADWALGAAFALVSTLIPYPMLATRFSAHITKIMFKNTATCFTGILSCFWAPSNTERSMSMVRIRYLVRTLDHLIEKFDSYDAFTFYEVLIYETSERREVRKEKVQLLLKLKMNLRAMERVINMVQERPQMIDLSERCLLLRDHLSLPMDDISRSMEALLWKLSEAKKYDQLRTLSGYFEAAGRAIKRLQTEFDVGRRVLLYEHQEASILRDGRMEEFVPLMTFFVFSIVNFWVTLEEFESFIDRHKATNDWKESFKLIWSALIDPFAENATLVRLLCVRRGEAEVRVVIEAAKVSVAMLIAVIFFYYVDNQSLLLTGPSIIAFVSGTNPVEAVQAGAARMSGTMIGAVLGFFAASLCHTAVDRVLALCIITFVMTFFRPGQKFGTICMYCNFVAVSGLAPTEQTADLTISRIQQNTFAIFIYCFISVAVFPVSPNHVLFKKRMSVMRSLNSTVQKLSSLFGDAARSYIEIRAEIQRGVKTEDDVVSIGHFLNLNDGFGLMPLRNGNTVVKLKGLNNSEMDTPATRSSSKLIMPRAFTMAPQDTIVEDIFTDIFSMMETMKQTSSVMPLAADEFQIIPHEYPLRASGDVHAALYRLCALVYTMTCAWKTMREKGYFTTDMLHILHNLSPIVNDIARCIDRFTHVMEFYVRFPSSGLSSELTKGAMQFRALGVELSARKEHDLIAVIRKTVAMKRIRDDRSDTAGGDHNEGGGGGGGGNGYGRDHGGGGGDGGYSPQQQQRSQLEEWDTRSSPKQHRGKWRHDPGQRKGSQRGKKMYRRAASSGRHDCRGASPSYVTSPSDAAVSGERVQNCDNDRLSHSQVRSAAPFFHTLTTHKESTPKTGDTASTASTFKDSVMPRIDSRDPTRSHITAPIPGDSAWLPVPRSELPAVPRQEEELNEDSIANTSPRSRVDGGGTVTNATRVFDASVFPPPPLDDGQAAAVRRATLAARLPPSMRGDTVNEHAAVLSGNASGTTPPSSSAFVKAAPTQLNRKSSGGDGPQQRYPHASTTAAALTPSSPSSSHTPPHRPRRRSSRHPQRLVAHEESPAVKKPSTQQRADQLRENLRGFQRHATTGNMTRKHSSFEMRTFGASYTNIATLDKSATFTSNNSGHYHSAHPRHHPHHGSPHQRAIGRSHSSLHYEDEEEDEEKEESPDEDSSHHRHRRCSRQADTTNSAGPESSLPYGSREGDLALLGSATQYDDTNEPASLSVWDPRTVEGVRRDGPPLPPLGHKEASGGRRHHSQDRITLHQSSSDDGDEGHKSYASDAESLSSSYSASSSYASDASGRSEYGSDSGRSDGDSNANDDGGSGRSSLVRFKDSFTTPIMVQDAEGLHAFTLSLEMFGKELRRVLYGLEEMLQSL